MNDQEYRTIYLMNICSRVYDAAYAWNTDPRKMTKDQEQMFSWLIKNGIR